MYQDWHVYSRGPMPLYRLDFFEAMRKGSLQHNKKSFCKVLFTYEKDISYWAWSRDGISEWSEILLKTIMDAQLLSKHYDEYETFCARSILASEKIRSEILADKSDQELLSLYKYLEEESGLASGLLNIDLDVFDICFDDFLKNKIRDKLASNKIRVTEQQFAELFRELSNPIYTTFVAQEEMRLSKLALKKKFNEKEIEKVLEDFWWVALGWESIVPRSFDYYREKIKTQLTLKNLDKTVFEMENRSEINRQKRKKILKKYRLGKEVKKLLEVFDRFAYFHDLRKETQMRAMFSFGSLLIEAAKRFFISAEDREFYCRSEIRELLRSGKKVRSEELQNRQKAFFLLAEKDGIKILSGEEAVIARKHELSQQLDEVIEFRGVAATKGNVRARIRVCNGIKDALAKLQKGEILVVGMTTPDYVPVMKIAGAIVTNEGGITCHAAIVSRELGIPCIVGTKIATQVLKDGDLVEVDADNGIVRKILV